MTHSIGLTHVVTWQWFHFSWKFCLSLWPHPNVHVYVLHAHMMCESSMIEHLSVQSFCLCFAIPISDLPAIALQNDYVWLDFIPKENSGATMYSSKFNPFITLAELMRFMSNKYEY